VKVASATKQQSPAKSKISSSRRKVFSSNSNERWQFRCVASHEMCQLKALEIMAEIEIQGFNTGQGWLQKFFK
jgi:hypothetical protein